MRNYMFSKFFLIFYLFLNITLLPVFSQAQDQAQQSDLAFDLSFQQYFIPKESDLFMPVASLYWKEWLFEARYNYEDRDAASAWLGKVYSFGNEWQFEITPMFGGIFGSFQGIAPGLKGDLTWHKFNLYTELEYVFDFDTRDNNFFYSWSELTYGLSDWLRVGIVGNRTRAYDSSVEVDRGPIVSIEFEKITLSCTALNLDEDPLFIAGLTFSFGD